MIFTDNTSLEFTNLNLLRQAYVKHNSYTLYDIFLVQPNLVLKFKALCVHKGHFTHDPRAVTMRL